MEASVRFDQNIQSVATGLICLNLSYVYEQLGLTPWRMSESLHGCETRRENEDRVSNKHLWVLTVLKE